MQSASLHCDCNDVRDWGEQRDLGRVKNSDPATEIHSSRAVLVLA